MSEGANFRIGAIKADARSFCCFANYRPPFLFNHGKLNLLPVLSLSAICRIVRTKPRRLSSRLAAGRALESKTKAQESKPSLAVLC
jgi:hypothetical protein